MSSSPPNGFRSRAGGASAAAQRRRPVPTRIRHATKSRTDIEDES
ncbi:hypothetical protein HMPREF9057_00373 [Actinomyces sp. oral taxon 171 str. F0337]|nr:hypothetical protein HMPREF9057_00373 [Actinomyces sp. oral taxon 171 str. F0337]